MSLVSKEKADVSLMFKVSRSSRNLLVSSLNDVLTRVQVLTHTDCEEPDCYTNGSYAFRIRVMHTFTQSSALCDLY